MLLASGLNYGFLRSLPHMLGISIGFALMVMGVGVGLSRLFTAYPPLYDALRIGGAVYLLYLAWQIATALPMQDSIGQGRPFGFWKAAGFQWVNPKAWTMAIGAVTMYVPEGGGIRAVTILSLVFAIVNAPSIAVWVVFGTGLRNWLTDASHLRVFNISMAILLVLSLNSLLAGREGG